MPTAIEIAREIIPDADDEELDFAIWEHTGFPAFWRIGVDGATPEECFRKQLTDYAEKRHDSQASR